MKNLLSKFNSDAYKWDFCSLGGVVRVNLTKGEDIAHLEELDQKLWTALSCPIKDMRFDAGTLSYLDSDGDGKIKVPEVIDASKWLCSVIKDKEVLIKGEQELQLDNIDTSNDAGRNIYETAVRILKELGRDKKSISTADTEEFAQKVIKSESEKEVVPYGENTEAALAAFDAMNDKVRDYFMRCKLIAFDEDAAAALDVSVEKISAVSGNILADTSAEIAACPLARPRNNGTLPLDEINPAWSKTFGAVKNMILDVDFKGKSKIEEKDWNSIAAKLDAYKASKAVKKVAEAEPFSVEVDKLVRYNRDFYSFLRNFVMFSDFYSLEDKAMFEAGELYIDQRCCKLCIKVSDMAAHADMAALSGMFLIYCTCTSKVKNDKMDIVAVMTYGDVRNLRPGKNAVFYDRDGLDWDAVVTKIVDNPISVRQAFWSPYRKFANFISEKISKSASAKESGVMADMEAKADKTVALPASAAASGSGAAASGAGVGSAASGSGVAAPKVPFDIAKFAGIFAAIGMALGYIGAFLTEVVTGVSTAPLWKTLLIILAIMICISGPSCFIAWIKLRKRNLGPVLNANGWAINSVVLVNIVFGSTLTSFAKYPKIALNDPFAEKKTPVWVKLLVVLLILAGIAAALYFTGHLTWAVAYFG